MVLYPVWHRCGFGPSTWPLAVIRSWSHFLAIIDYARGKTMQWQVTGSGASPVKRLWIGLTAWNGSAAIAWLSLAGLRIAQYGITRFWIITMFGLLYAGITGFILLTRRPS
jgi:cellulose synthase (UDP-forming)